MVNKAYPNRVNLVLLWRPATRNSAGKRGHPFGLRIDREGRYRQRDAIGNTGILAVQPLGPLPALQQLRHRHGAKLNQRDRQSAAKQGSVDEIIGEMAKTEPERRDSRKFGVAAADPALRKTDKRHHQHTRTGAGMAEYVVSTHSRQDCKQEKTAGEDQ